MPARDKPNVACTTGLSDKVVSRNICIRIVWWSGIWEELVRIPLDAYFLSVFLVSLELLYRNFMINLYKS